MKTKVEALVEKLIGQTQQNSFERVKAWKEKCPDARRAAKKLACDLDGQFEFEDTYDLISSLWAATSPDEVDKALKEDEGFLNIVDVMGGLGGWSPR